MKQYIFLWSLVSFFLLWVVQTSAIYIEPIKYSTQTEFEQAEGWTCKSATDGCNTFFMSDDGKVAGWTRMFCADAPVEWSCIQKKDEGMMSIMLTSEPIENLYDTMSPVLSTNDQWLYNNILNTLGDNYQQRVQKTYLIYSTLKDTLSFMKQEKIQARFIELIEERIEKLLMKYPQDIALPENANNTYMMFTLLKFKVQLGE